MLSTVRSSFFNTEFSTEGTSLTGFDYLPVFKNDILALRTLLEKATEEENSETSDSVNKRIDINMLEYEKSNPQIYYRFGQTTSDVNCKLNEIKNSSSINSKLKIIQNKIQIGKVITNPKYKCRMPWLHELSRPISYQPSKLNKVIFVIRMYKPYFDAGKQNMRLLQEFHLTGRSSLNNLANLIKCNHDYCGLSDVSNEIRHGDVRNHLECEAKKKYPASFFFIENSFYCNSSCAGGDISDELRNWLDTNNVGNFNSLSMGQTLLHIPLRIGRPCVYQHQGNCEHVFVFSDVRFVTAEEANEAKAFPAVSAIGYDSPRECSLCQEAFSKWLVTNYLDLTLEKAYLCQRCLISYCYVDGRKLGQFQVYKYVDPVSVV